MVKVDKETCIGCAACAVICEDVFEMNDEDMKAYVKKDANHSHADIDESIECCPVDAISK